MNGLTEKEKQFLSITRVTNDPGKASAIVYNQPNVMQMLKKKPVLKREIEKILDRAGLKKKYLVEKMKGVIDTDPDNKNVLRAVDMAFDLHGAYAPKEIDINETKEIYGHLEITEIRKQITELASTFEED